MPVLVHLADERESASIKKNGIKPGKLRKGIYCMPVLPEFYVSHQWLRELKRRGIKTLVAVYFKLPASTRVFAGKYNQPHIESSLGFAIGEMKKLGDQLGYEFIVPRKIKATEIHKIRRLSQNIGWRYYPGSNKKKPCSCPYCSVGDIKGKRLRDKYNEPEKSPGYHQILNILRTSEDEDEILQHLTHLKYKRVKSDPKALEFLLDSDSLYIRRYFASALRGFRHKNAKSMLQQCLLQEDAEVKENAAFSLLKRFGKEGEKILKASKDKVARRCLAEWRLEDRKYFYNR